MKRFKYTLALFFMALSVSVFSQSRMLTSYNTGETSVPQYMFIANYNMGFAVGNTNDHVKESSFRGASMEFRAFLNNYVSVGGAIDYQNFYEDLGKGSINYKGTNYYGSKYHWMYSVPVMAVAHYYPLGANNKFAPYVGLGAGVMYNDSEVHISGVGFYTDSWQFGAMGEIGAIYNITQSFGLNVAARYNQSAKTDRLPGQSYFTLKFGGVLSF